MANLGLFFPNRCQPSVAVAGGSWLTDLPASNVCTPELARVARSTDALAASTRFQVDLGTPRPLRALALVNHNLSDTATWAVQLGSLPGGTDVYSGPQTPWLTVGSELGLIAQGMEDGVYLRDGTPAIVVLPASYTARHVSVEIVDTANPDGYVQVGRAFVGGGFIPEINAAYGLQDGWVDLSTKLESESGSEWPTPRRRLREVNFVLEAVSLMQGDYLHEMQRVLGTVDEVLYVPDVADPATTQRYGMLGTMRELSPLEYPYFRRRSMPLRIRQKG